MFTLDNFENWSIVPTSEMLFMIQQNWQSKFQLSLTSNKMQL